MADEPFYIVEREGFRATFILGSEDDPVTIDDVDVYVDLPDGTRWGATFMTMDAIGRIWQRWEVTGERLGGIYFQSDDLVLVREPGIAPMTDIIQRLVNQEDSRLEYVFKQLDPPALP